MAKKRKTKSEIIISKIKVMSPPPSNWVVGVADRDTLDFASSELLSEQEASELHRVLTKLFV